VQKEAGPGVAVLGGEFADLLRNGLVVFRHAPRVQGQRLLGHPSRAIKVDARRDAARKVGEGHAVIAAGVLVDQRNVLRMAISV
jgi:hypothetical protein